MLVVKIYMWPDGDWTRERLVSVGTFGLVNVAKNKVRTYHVRLLKEPRFGGPTDSAPPARISQPHPRSVWRQGIVTGHRPGPRGAWDLVGGALRVLLDRRLADYASARHCEVADG